MHTRSKGRVKFLSFLVFLCLLEIRFPAVHKHGRTFRVFRSPAERTGLQIACETKFQKRTQIVTEKQSLMILGDAIWRQGTRSAWPK
jgi:hypothetical protein